MDGQLRQIFRKNLPHAQWTAVETGATAAGVPDSEYCFPSGSSGWVEFKSIAGWRVTLRPAQIGWLLRRHRMGGQCFVAILRGDTLYVEPGSSAVALREVGVKDLPGWSGGPSAWPWAQVERKLRGGQ